MKRRTFLAGIAAAIASFAVPGSRDRIVFTATAALVPVREVVIVEGRDGTGRTVREEIDLGIFKAAASSPDGYPIPKEIRSDLTVTFPAMPAPDAPPPMFSINIT